MDRFDHIFVAPQDFARTLAFYRDGLGWRVAAQWGSGSSPRGAQLESDGGMRIVIAERHDAADDSWTGGFNGVRPTVHVATDDLRARFARLGADVRVVVAPQPTHWGVDWFVVADPDGNLIAFVEAKPGR